MADLPPQTADKAVWTTIATAGVSVVLMATGVIPMDLDAFSWELQNVLTLIAAVAVQAAVAGAATYFKRNRAK